MFRFHYLRALSALAAAACLAAMSPSAWASRRLVPSQYSTIQAAINASVGGDEVVVSPGTYNESITLNRAVTVTGLNPGDPLVTLATVIRGNTTQPVVTFATTGPTALDGLTVTNGSEGVSVLPGAGGGLISKCLIQANYGSGIRLEPGSGGTTVSFCRVINNNSSGIFAATNTTLTVEAGLVAGNQAGGIHMGSCVSTSIIRDCVIVGNATVDRGGGIYSQDSTVTISNCTIANNQANLGGGMYFYSLNYPDTVTVTHSIVWGNTAYTGAAFVLDGDAMGWPETFAADYSDIQAGTYVGQGHWSWSVASSCFSCDPQFVSAAGPDGNPATWADNDYHIQRTSPCFNAGNPAFVPASGQTDSDGQARVLYGRVDIGADEFLLAGDVNHDGYINVGDLQAMVATWGSQAGPPPGSNWNANADFNNDGFINVGDLRILVANWTRSL